MKIILEGPNDILIEQPLRFEFKAYNNQTEYEAPIANMVLTLEMGNSYMKAKSDSQLTENHVTREYQTKDP